MSATFAECNPQLFGLAGERVPGGATNELVMNCPWCKQRFSLYVNFGGPAVAPAVWGISVPDYDLNKATLTPSISNHPVPKSETRHCHFSVINGEIRP